MLLWYTGLTVVGGMTPWSDGSLEQLRAALLDIWAVVVNRAVVGHFDTDVMVLAVQMKAMWGAWIS